ncbi:MAG: cytochrome c oxidase accessory protein FixG [bacterium]|jgi:cytochrome c oxidase accessory protein FixG
MSDKNTPNTFRKYRHQFFIFATFLMVGIPFITINGNHLFMLSLIHQKFEFFGIGFDIQELYLIPLILILCFMIIFIITAVGGRVWCGWACPQTMFRTLYRDYIQGKLLGLRKVENKQKALNLKKPIDKVKYVIGVLLWSSLAFLAAANLLWFFVDPFEFFEFVFLNPSEHSFLAGFYYGLVAFLISDVILLQENFCKHICPYARIQSVLFDEDTIIALYDKNRGDNTDGSRGNRNLEKQKDLSGDCTGCQACVRVCPTGIDIRKGLQLECIACLECSDACGKVMAKYDKPNLITWASEKMIEKDEKFKPFRGRILSYTGLLVLVFISLVYLGANRDTMLLNVNRTSQLYQIKDSGKRVENYYTLMVTNTDTKTHEFVIEIKGLKGVQVRSPKDSFSILPGGQVKKILILSTTQQLVQKENGNTSFPITIHSKAVDAPNLIQIEKKTVFIYPSLSEIQKQKKLSLNAYY